MADTRIDRINSEIHSSEFEIKPGLLAELLLDSMGPLLFERYPPAHPGRQISPTLTEPSPRT